jgi:2-phospho-L-lactate transferase/gluconeogenesis factor (CofD/UPF0052 family)
MVVDLLSKGKISGPRDIRMGSTEVLEMGDALSTFRALGYHREVNELIEALTSFQVAADGLLNAKSVATPEEFDRARARVNVRTRVLIATLRDIR